MTKITLNELASLDSPTGANTNFDRIESAFDNTLSRDGTGPNQMEADFDLNSYDIINGGAAAFASLTVAGVEITGSGGGGGGGAGSIIIDGNSSTTLVATGTGVSSSYDPSTGTTTLTFTAGSGGGGGGNPVQIEDEGVTLTPAVTKINFEGAGVTVTEPVADEVLVTIAGPSIEVQDETVSLTDAVTKINFEGAGVTVTEPVEDEVLVTIPGGSGGVVTDAGVASFADLQAAITAATGGTIFITQDWNVSSQLNIPANTQVFGAGGSFTLTAAIRMFSLGLGAKLNNLILTGQNSSASATTQDVAAVITANDVEISNCTLYNFAGWSFVLDANLDRPKITNVTLDGCNGGVVVNGTSGNEVRALYISDFTMQGGSSGSSPAFDLSFCDGAYINGVALTDIRGAALEIDNSDGCYFANWHMEDCCRGGTTHLIRHEQSWDFTYIGLVYFAQTASVGPTNFWSWAGTQVRGVIQNCGFGGGAGNFASPVYTGTWPSRVKSDGNWGFGRAPRSITLSGSSLNGDTYTDWYEFSAGGTWNGCSNVGQPGDRFTVTVATGTVTVQGGVGNLETPDNATFTLGAPGSGADAQVAEVFVTASSEYVVIGLT